MRFVQVLEAAALEAEAAAEWYEHQRTGLGGEFREALKAALDALRGGVVPGSPWPGRLGERGVKRIRMKRFPYYVVFVAPETTPVVAIIASLNPTSAIEKIDRPYRAAASRGWRASNASALRAEAAVRIVTDCLNRG